MRIIRIPYWYLSDNDLRQLYSTANNYLKVIYSLHHHEPTEYGQLLSRVKHFMYHPSFLIWVFDKGKQEMIDRGMKPQIVLSDGIRNLRSRRLSEFIPPDDAEIAEDVVCLLERWSIAIRPGGKKLPSSYVDLAKEHYDYNPDKACYQRIDQDTWHDHHSDSGWYRIQGQASPT